MKISLEIEDHESGRVNVKSTPTMQQLLAARKAGKIGPAEGYAILAMAAVIKESQRRTQEEMAEQWNDGKIPMFESERKMFK